MQDANIAKKSPSGLRRAISSQLKHVSTIGKNLLNSNISPTRPHNMVNFSLLAAEIVSLVWGTPANFNGFRVLASLLQRCLSTEAKQTFHNVWPLPRLVDYIHLRRLLLRNGILPSAKFTVCVLQVLRSPVGSITARQSSSGREPNFAALNTGRHLCSAGRPSRWALVHVLVSINLPFTVAVTDFAISQLTSNVDRPILMSLFTEFA